jgi:hypothetical protein
LQNIKRAEFRVAIGLEPSLSFFAGQSPEAASLRETTDLRSQEEIEKHRQRLDPFGDHWRIKKQIDAAQPRTQKIIGEYLALLRL